MTREEHLIGDITRETPVLEIGPSYNPVVSKADGWNVQVVDHATKAELEEKYRQWDVDVSRMEEVDHLWTGGPLHEAVPAALHGGFGRVVASHVIEHMPDLLSFLRSVTRLLAPEGRLVLAVPDKRFCFNYFRPTTMTSDVVAAHLAGQGVGTGRHTAKSAFETYFYNANAGGSIAWWGAPTGAIGLHHEWNWSMSLFDAFKRTAPSTYLDMHASTFTPCSLELIVTELAAIGLCELVVEELHRTDSYEFYAVLKKDGAGLRLRGAEQVTARRLALMRGMLEETHAQVEMLRAAEARDAAGRVG